MSHLLRITTAGLALILVAEPAFAYIGPGAGVSILGALFGFISILFLAIWSLAKWCVGTIFRTRRAGAAAASTPSQVTTGTGLSGEAEQYEVPARRPVSYSWIPLFVATAIAVAGWLEGPRAIVTDSVNAVRHVAEGFGTANWHTSPARYDSSQQGVVTHNPARAFPGYNLEVSAVAHQARLLDMEGREVHRWAIDRNAISRAWAANGEPLNDVSALYWRRVKPLPDGSLLVIFENSRTTPYATGMIKLDWNSKLIWTAPRRYHHSLDVGPDGKIYTLHQKVSEQPPEHAHWILTPYLDEGIAILDANGRELERIGILDALARSPYASLLKRLANPLKDDDPLHLNTVRYIDAGIASRLPFAKPGDLLISIRNLHAVMILDPVTKTVTWARSGLWFMQHEPVFTNDGTLLVFDNLGPADGLSRVIEWDPESETVEWNWKGKGTLPLSSAKYSAVEILPNGNRLITSSYGGRAIEVSPEKEIVWEWRTDHRFGDAKELVGNLMEIIRVPLDFFTQEISLLLKDKDQPS